MDFPYIAHCKYCNGNGQILFWKCGECQKILGVCDECDSGWKDLDALYKDNTLEADYEIGEKCPICGNDSLLGKFLNNNEVTQFPECSSVCFTPTIEVAEESDKIDPE